VVSIEPVTPMALPNLTTLPALSVIFFPDKTSTVPFNSMLPESVCNVISSAPVSSNFILCPASVVKVKVVASEEIT